MTALLGNLSLFEKAPTVGVVVLYIFLGTFQFDSVPNDRIKLRLYPSFFKVL
jgi:hypothetical protein